MTGEQDIAVVGLAVRLPDAPTLGDFWRNLVRGHESVRTFTDAELLAEGVPPQLLRDPRYVKAGVVLEGMDQFDPEFFGFSPKEAAIMDPQHRHFLECVWEALEDSTHVPGRFPGPIGVFAGCGMGSYFTFNVLRNRKLLDEVGLFLLRHTGNDKDFLATRVSYCLDLRGPSINIQTACSTSLVAIHYAAQSLLSGECDMAVAGGVTFEIPHRRGYVYHEGEVLSPDGHCRAFDHRSRGTVFGSGATVVVLRRLADALQDGDHVYAVVKGSSVNNDGARKVGYLAPSVDGQAAAMAEAMALAGVDPDDISYVECHGTGTEIGDPIEVSALTQAFAGSKRRQYCGLGSVKTNIGHLDTAAGAASFIKACLSLHHEEIPPSLNFEAPNPLIDFVNSPFYVNDRLRPWRRGGKPRYASVNSLGVGGTNAHVVLAEAPNVEPASLAGSATLPGVLVWSARNARSLDDYARRLAAHLRAHPDQHVLDVASTLAHGRQAFPKRRVTAFRDREHALRLLEGEEQKQVHTHTATESAKVVFLFPGGGAQHRHMARGLYATDVLFREHADRGLRQLAGLVDVDVRELWLGDAMDAAEVDRQLDRLSIQLPLIFLVEYSLAQCWLARGVRPTALLGHSLGEYSAACLAGVFSFEDCLRLVALRGRLLEPLQGGAMISVPLSAAECQRRMPASLDLATVNAPELCVISGPAAEVHAFAAKLAEEGIECQVLRIPVAGHSRMLDPVLDEFGAFLRTMRFSAPKLAFVSNRTGTWITEQQATSPQYWVDHLRNTVLFAAGVDLLVRDGRNVFVEVGPGRTLSSLVRLHPSWTADRSAIPSLRHPEERIDDEVYWRSAHARLWAAGVEVPLEDLVPVPRRRLSLPTYAFRHQRYWVDADPAGQEDRTGTNDRVDDVAKWQWVPEWQRCDAPAPAAAAEPGTWLVFVDELGVGKRLAARLRGRKLDVVEVHLGDSFGKLGEGRYAIAPELGREGYDALLRELAASGRQLRGVAHLWLLTRDHGFRPGSSFFHRCEEQGFYSLFFLAQALGGEDLPEDCRIVVFANELDGPADAARIAAVRPEKALVLGPGLCMPRELPGVQCRVVDLEVRLDRWGRTDRGALDQLAAVAERELAARDSGQFAWRGDTRSRLAHAARELPPARTELPARLRERGTYLITGGLGGIASLVAEWLARTSRARLILVTRRSLPPRDQWDRHLASAPGPVSQAIQKVRWLESLGAEVHVATADIADVVQLRAAIAEARGRFGPVHGVFHAAGVVQDELMANKEQATIERVLAPKVQGSLVLAEVLGDEPLDFTVLFSSTSAILGPPGQVDYVAANAFLNALARQRSAAGRPTVALQWGTWNRVGMTASLDAGRAAEAGRPEAIAQPLLQEKVQVTADEAVLTGRLAASTHWLLDEHRTGQGHALVPGTGFLELAAESLAAVGESMPFEVRDLYFFRPLYVPDGQSRAIRAHLRRSIEGYELEVESEVVLDEPGGSGKHGWQTHAQARIVLGHLQPPERVDLAAISARCLDVRRPVGADWIPSPQEANLRFGPRWRVVRELRYGDGEALATVALDESFAGDLASHRLHPALLDLATGYAMELVPGYDPRNLWVPLAYRSFRVHDRLPREVRSWVRRCVALGTGGDLVSTDLVLAAPDGRVLVEIEGFQMRRLAADQEFALAGAPVAAKPDHAPRGAVSGAEQLLAENIQKGIRQAEGVEALARVLAGELPVETVLTPVPLPGLLEELGKVQLVPDNAGTRFARPELDNEYVAPRDDVEQGLVRLWEELLGIDAVGVKDDFFALGGHSLIAVRLFAKIKKTYRIDYPMSVLFEAPTIEALAARMRQDGVAGASSLPSPAAAPAPQSRYRHLVAMHPSRHGDGTPFFLVAGMFGNVLNLRHLAQLIGADRPFYGLQARGLFGDMQPHTTFEEAARDYLEEVRSVQPHGPYLLGGFSGGGLTAYEMARQLRAAGEEVSILVMLDTPLPGFEWAGRLDRLKIQWQRLRRGGVGHLWQMVRNRLRWEMEKVQRRLGGEPLVEEPATFHSEAIEIAFRKALDAYRLEPQPLRVWLFRPPLPKVYDLGGGRYANKDRMLVHHDNRWTPYVRELHVVEVPGDHDSMVLEPNVRSLAAEVRRAIDAATRPAAAPAARAPALV